MATPSARSLDHAERPVTGAPLVISLPIADRPTAYAFYRRALGLEAIGEPANKRVPEPLQFIVNVGVRVLLRPALGLGAPSAPVRSRPPTTTNVCSSLALRRRPTPLPSLTKLSLQGPLSSRRRDRNPGATSARSRIPMGTSGWCGPTRWCPDRDSRRQGPVTPGAIAQRRPAPLALAHAASASCRICAAKRCALKNGGQRQRLPLRSPRSLVAAAPQPSCPGTPRGAAVRRHVGAASRGQGARSHESLHRACYHNAKRRRDDRRRKQARGMSYDCEQHDDIWRLAAAL